MRIPKAFHPAMRLRRLQARFTDTETGRKVNVESYRHLIADYVNAAVKAGLRIERIQEHLADESLLEKSPRAKSTGPGSGRISILVGRCCC